MIFISRSHAPGQLMSLLVTPPCTRLKCSSMYIIVLCGSKPCEVSFEAKNLNSYIVLEKKIPHSQHRQKIANLNLNIYGSVELIFHWPRLVCLNIFYVAVCLNIYLRPLNRPFWLFLVVLVHSLSLYYSLVWPSTKYYYIHRGTLEPCAWWGYQQRH